MTSGQARFPVAPSMFKFTATRTAGRRVDQRADAAHRQRRHELCFVHSMHTEAINHEPAITFFQTGTSSPAGPSFGAWASYGLGSDNANLPTFVVLITQGIGNMQALSARFWGSGFLPSEHQGCKLRSGGDPVLFLGPRRACRARDRRACSTSWRAQRARASARSTPRSRRASRSTRWPSACRCRCPS
jgi:hypothetical protein